MNMCINMYIKMDLKMYIYIYICTRFLKKEESPDVESGPTFRSSDGGRSHGVPGISVELELKERERRVTSETAVGASV